MRIIKKVYNRCKETLHIMKMLIFAFYYQSIGYIVWHRQCEYVRRQNRLWTFIYNKKK